MSMSTPAEVAIFDVFFHSPAELQKLGFPVFTADVLPRDPDLLNRLFGDEIRRGELRSPLGLEDVWKNAYSENTYRKV